jgi:methionyl aminopeptidase
MPNGRRKMIHLKTPEEIELIRIACKELSLWMEDCLDNLRRAYSYTNGVDIRNSFDCYFIDLNKRYPDNAWTRPFKSQLNQKNELFDSPVCISVNDEIVHGRPTDKLFETGDIITVDAGLAYHGWCSDMARTVIFNKDPKELDPALLRSCRSALYQAYEQCKPGNTIGDISTVISAEAAEHGFGVIVDYMGHGIGKTLHEEPRICNRPGLFPQYDSVVLRPGMVICIEPMFTKGSGKTILAPDKWMVWTQDGSLAAHFESQILITSDGREVLTRLIEEYS